MADQLDSATPPQDSGPPDVAERDGAALGSAEDFDEDRLRVDPLEAGMDPPEQWMGSDRYGVTHYEQSHPRPLSARLTEEEPDVRADLPLPPEDEPPPLEPDSDRDRERDVSTDPEDDIDATVLAEASGRGQLADEAGGSVASAIRTPPPPE